MSKPKRAAIYCRISKDRTGAQAGTQRQERDCRELVERHGWQLVDVFTDDDTSAYSGRPRPAYERLLAAVEAGHVDVVVAWHPDRLTRSPRELEDLIDALEASRCQVETLRAGRVDLSTRSGRTTARLIGAVARDESEAKAERLQAMHADRARRGLFHGGPRPYGYQPDPAGNLVVVEPEAAIIRESAERVLAGEWLGQVAADLNDRGVATARGARWRVQTLRGMLTSPTVAGIRRNNGADAPAAWPAILDADTVRMLRARLYDPSRARGTVARVALLAGIARCYRCEAKLITQRRANKGRTRVYVCPARSRGGCGAVQIAAEPLEEHVSGVLLAELDRPDFLEHLAGDDGGRRAELAEALAHLEDRRRELADMWADGTLGAADWSAARGALDRREADLQSELADLPAPAGAIDPQVILDAWELMTLAERRHVIAHYVEAVIVSPATRRGPTFDTDRVSLSWREA